MRKLWVAHFGFYLPEGSNGALSLLRNLGKSPRTDFEDPLLVLSCKNTFFKMNIFQKRKYNQICLRPIEENESELLQILNVSI